MMRLLWLICGLLSLALGIIGIPLPFLPTVPFLLLAAFCFARSSQRLHDWLLAHERLGPPIIAWRDHRAITRSAKYMASLSMAAAFGMSLLLGFGPLVLALQALVLGAAALFVWTRPDR